MSGSAALRRTLDPALVAASKALATLLVLASGFRAISDDDYARVVIAQRFAAAPALDPSGTSWLPFPFYVYGGALATFGSTLEVARGVALVLGALGSVALWFAARLLGLGRAGALAGALLGSWFPYSAYLGAATVPEAPIAALTVLGVATLALPRSDVRLLGAAALFVATGSRYESWASAAAFFALTLWDARRSRNLRLAFAAVPAIAFPLAWLLHGIVRHGDALFFVTRVASYRAALGPDDPLFERLLRAPISLVLREPELACAFLLVMLPLAFQGPNRRSPTLTRVAPALAAPLLLVMLGDVRGAAPTHHPERAHLALWFGAALALAGGIEQLALSGREARRLLIEKLGAALIVGFVLRQALPRDPFVDRRSAEDIGRRAFERGIERLAIVTPDYAYFAVEAGYGRPTRTWVLDDRDPRKPHAERDWRDSKSLRERLTGRQVDGLVLPRSETALARELAPASEVNRDYVLLTLSQN